MLAKATLAGGCFWCLQGPFDQLEGVVQTLVGYTGGIKINPTYDEVCTGKTGHTEAVQITYEPTKISYEKLLEVFWRQIDPTIVNAQFADVGSQYRTGIFYHDEAQKKAAELSKKNLASSGRFTKPIVTEITQAEVFYRAEEYHQKYYEKNQADYQAYHQGSGRKKYLEKTWSK